MTCSICLKTKFPPFDGYEMNNTNSLMQILAITTLDNYELIDNSLTFLTLTGGLLFFVVGLLFKILPPKKINSIYGYRTSSSMRNLDTWVVANKFSARLMIVGGISLTNIGLLSLIFPNMGGIGTGISVGLLVLFVIVLIVETEKHLNKMFDKDGHRRIT